jgi:hydrogenase maturation protein HypF
MTSTQLIRVFGIVQGVGFRPFVSRAADRCGVFGSVANKGSYVEIHAQGGAEALTEFRRILKEEPPERSLVLKLETTQTNEPVAERFSIIDSEKEAGDIFVSPDIATCKKCREELFDRTNRRYHHPFINCTACGPRVTILDSMPYDRERTSMGEFPMCPQCEYEYTHPETRRYDAQPVCCNECGPQVYLMDRPERGSEAITAVRRAIMEGRIAAVKGIGGFHLCCDASNDAAVARLRRLKNRPMKPFAVMLRDLAAVRRECEPDATQEEILDGHQKPILLLPRKPGGRLSRLIAPGNPTVGVMLPYAPVQMLLFDYDDGVEMTDCLVMTSGNVSGAPICRCDEDVRAQIAGFCDVVLSHDRKIRLRADDSVMDFLEGKPYMIRRSRGYAPLPFLVSRGWKGQVLGIGGELKNTFCLGKNELFYPSPYLGDMEDIRTVQALRESVERMSELLECKPELVACDLHPKYNTVAAAEELGLPVFRVQHHYAHILSCMAENDYTERVIGVSFDGTGYGTDGTIWGGEFLAADFNGFERLGSVEPFRQVGGDASAREGWRIAVSLLQDGLGDRARETISALALCSERDAHVLHVMAEKKLNTVKSTSAGRLFDAVSAILGIRLASTFEGEASMALEFAAEDFLRRCPAPEEETPLSLRFGRETFTLPTDALVLELARRRLQGEEPGRLAWLFHRQLAQLIVAGCEKIRADTGLSVCALSGGVFQNRLLAAECAAGLRRKGFRVLLHSLVPPNDGGIALGQAAAAMYRLNKQG